METNSHGDHTRSGAGRPGNGGSRPTRPAGSNGARPAGGSRPTGTSRPAGTGRPAGNPQRPAGNPQRPTGGTQRPTGTTQRPAGSSQRPTGGARPTQNSLNTQKGYGPNRGPSSNVNPRQAAAKSKQAKKKRKIILFAVEIIVILALIVVAWQVFRMAKPNEGVSYTVIDQSPEKLEITEEVQQNEVMKGYMNIALFGVDATTESQLYRGSRSDSMMIASINMDTGDIRLVSVYRDTFLNIDDRNSYQKANHSYSVGQIDDIELKGGPEPAMKMLNKNLDLNIQDFVTVGYKGLSEVIDGLGGIYLDVDSTEIQHINNYQIGISESLKCSYKPVTQTGYQLLDGIQASAYCRIRYGGGDDFKRASRQREVIKAIEAKAKEADLDTLTKVFETASKHIFTSIDSKDIVSMLGNIQNYRIVEEDGFPQENMRTIRNMGAKGSCVIPIDLESNVIWLHQFLFEEQDYQVTDKVKEYSSKISAEASKYAGGGSNE